MKVAIVVNNRLWQLIHKLVIFLNFNFNPLLRIGHYSVRMTKISISIQEGILKKNSDERRAYESVNEKSLF